MRKLIKNTIAVLFLLIVLFVIRTLHAGGTFKSITPHEYQPMHVVKGMVGAEDIVIDRQLGKALVSALDRRAYLSEKGGEGAIYLFDYQANPPSFTNLTDNLRQEEFQPHGISLYYDQADSTKWVHVVNHGSNGHTIEVFRFTDTSLIHEETISDPAICSPNDVIATGRRSFYFTNDHDSAGGIDRWKDYLLIGTGQVGYFEDGEVVIFDTDLGYANGINLTADKSHILVACSTGREVLVYDRKTHQRVGRIDCGTSLDNIELDQEGHLWIGCHPKMLAFSAHQRAATSRSPSQVIKIELDPSDFSKSKIAEIYLNNGDPLSGSSVATVDGDILLLGTVFEDGVGVTKWK